MFFIVSKQNKKQNKDKWKTYQKQSQHKNRKAEPNIMKTKTKTTYLKTAKRESNLGFKKGMLGKYVSKEQANINKGKDKKGKMEETPQNIFSKKVDGQKAKKKDRRKTRNNRIWRKERF